MFLRQEKNTTQPTLGGGGGRKKFAYVRAMGHHDLQGNSGDLSELFHDCTFVNR